MIRVLSVIGILATLLAASCPVSAWADVLELKSGQKLEGQYAGGSKDEVRFQVGSQTLKFAVAEISRITFGTTSQDDFLKAAKDVLRQLKALASTVEGGITYRDYAPRVTDAKIKVDQFLDEYKSSPLPRFNEHVADSLGFYAAAATAWNAGISKSAEGLLAIAGNKYVPKCAPLQEEVARHEGKFDPAITIAIVGMRPLWECARSSMLDAEKVLQVTR